VSRLGYGLVNNLVWLSNALMRTAHLISFAERTRRKSVGVPLPGKIVPAAKTGDRAFNTPLGVGPWIPPPPSPRLAGTPANRGEQAWTGTKGQP